MNIELEQKHPAMVFGKSFKDAMRQWSDENVDCEISPAEAVAIDLLIPNHSVNLYRVMKRVNIPLNYHYAISDHDTQSGHVRLLAFDVRDLARKVNNRALDQEKFRHLKNPLASAGRMVNKYVRNSESSDVLASFCEEFGQ